MSEKNFVDGLIVKRNEKAPSFIIAQLSFKVGDFTHYCGNNSKNGWLNVDVKLSKGGKYYAELNTWTKENAKPKVVEEEENQAKLNNLGTEETLTEKTLEILPDDIPF